MSSWVHVLHPNVHRGFGTLKRRKTRPQQLQSAQLGRLHVLILPPAGLKAA